VKTFKEAVLEASQYRTVTDIAVGNYQFYKFLDSKGWLKPIHKHLTVKRKIWYPCTATAQALKYKSKGEFLKLNPSCFRFLKKINLLDQACKHMFSGKSKGEEAVFKLLTEEGVNFEVEKVFQFAKEFRFDFYLPDRNLVIEIHGRQHREFSKHFHKTEENFRARQLVDLEKKKLILSKNIKYKSFDYTSQRKDSIGKMIKELVRFLRIKNR